MLYRSHSEAEAEQSDGDLQMWWEFWPSERTASCLCKLSGIFLIPMGILSYDLSVPTKTIFSRYPDTQHSVKHTYASIIRVNSEILMHMYQLSTANSDASENENKIN